LTCYYNNKNNMMMDGRMTEIMPQITDPTPYTKIRWFEQLGKPPYYKHPTVDLLKLTPRELAAFELFACGLTIPEVAQTLHTKEDKPISRFTANDYEKGIYDKLGLANRVEQVKAAIASGAVALATGEDLKNLIDSYTTLPPRAREAFEQIALGQTIKQAAEQMGVQYFTVNDYLKLIHDAFDINNKVDLTRRYVALKLEADRLMQEKIRCEQAGENLPDEILNAPLAETVNTQSLSSAVRALRKNNKVVSRKLAPDRHNPNAAHPNGNGCNPALGADGTRSDMTEEPLKDQAFIARLAEQTKHHPASSGKASTTGFANRFEATRSEAAESDAKDPGAATRFR
jgi:DNA-binding NarL/FixJ family response regulator